MSTATQRSEIPRALLRGVAVVLVRVCPLRVLRGLERAIDAEVLRRAMRGAGKRPR